MKKGPLWLKIWLEMRLDEMTTTRWPCPRSKLSCQRRVVESRWLVQYGPPSCFWSTWSPSWDRTRRWTVCKRRKVRWNSRHPLNHIKVDKLAWPERLTTRRRGDKRLTLPRRSFWSVDGHPRLLCKGPCARHRSPDRTKRSPRCILESQTNTVQPTETDQWVCPSCPAYQCRWCHRWSAANSPLGTCYKVSKSSSWPQWPCWSWSGCRSRSLCWVVVSKFYNHKYWEITFKSLCLPACLGWKPCCGCVYEGKEKRHHKRVARVRHEILAALLPALVYPERKLSSLD